MARAMLPSYTLFGIGGATPNIIFLLPLIADWYLDCPWVVIRLVEDGPLCRWDIILPLRE
jgi:hypothetical protein